MAPILLRPLLEMDESISQLIRGDKRMLSRLISIVEQEGPQGAQVMADVFPHCGNAYCIGITGPPGAGKSTLVDSLVKVIRSRGLTAGVIAVDPTSAYSGGAFLGDRIRMQRHFMDPGVYIRSMATRSNPGGLPRMVQGAVQLLDAAGTDFVLVETVGVGQTELGIMDVADSVVVVMMPESGDVIQTLKAGLMEVADIYVVNKSDLQGADKMVAALGRYAAHGGSIRRLVSQGHFRPSPRRRGSDRALREHTGASRGPSGRGSPGEAQK